MSLRKDDGRNQKLINSVDGEEGRRDKSTCPKTWKVAVVILLVCSLFLVGVIIGFYISQAYEQRRDHTAPSALGEPEPPAKNSGDFGLGPKGNGPLSGDPFQLIELHQSVVDSLASIDNVGNLTSYTNFQLYTGSSHDLELTDIVWKYFNNSGFDDVSNNHYNVLLSFPNLEDPSHLEVISSDGQMIYDGDFRSSRKPEYFPGYVAYSPAANVQGELIYLNRGSEDDFARASGRKLEGKIGLVRLDQTRLEDKVRLAEWYKMAGLLVYEDSLGLHQHSKQHRCTNNTQYAVLSYTEGGDPLSPGFPAIDGIWRLPISVAKLPNIPIQILSCQATKILLNHLKVNQTTKTGESTDLNTLVVRLHVTNQLVTKPVFNIMATIYGEKDSDHSILIGASRNSFRDGSYGGITGTEILLQVSSAVTKLFHNQNNLWIPQRTIRFVSWGGSDFGHMGFTEFLEMYHDIWRGKVVAYINLDNPLIGWKFLGKSRDIESEDQVILTSSASLESLTRMVFEQLKKEEPIPKFVWQKVAKKTVTQLEQDPVTLLMKHLPSPYVHVQVAVENQEGSKDSETIQNAKRYVRQFSALLTLTLADAGVLQLQIHRTAHEVAVAVNRLIGDFSAMLPNHTITIEALRGKTKQLRKATTDLEDFISRHLEYEHHEDVRLVNSILLQADAEITKILTDTAAIQDRFRLDTNGRVTVNWSARDDRCDEIINADILLASSISELIARIAAATKIMVMTG